MHLQGPSSIKKVTDKLLKKISQNEVKYFIRTDIKSYYASIDHCILLQQLFANFADKRLHNYFQQIITIPIDKDGVLFSPNKGIPLRSSLSLFFAALYLSPLDRAFAKRQVYYLRYVDDVIILFKNKKQFSRGKKLLAQQLKALKLKMSPHKTKMGAIEKGFHFLGVEYCISQKRQYKSQVTGQTAASSQELPVVLSSATATLHQRSYRRALDRVQLLQESAVHPAEIQLYLVRWSAWWARTVRPMSITTLLKFWIKHTQLSDPSCVWYASGILTISYQLRYADFGVTQDVVPALADHVILPVA